MSTPARIVSFVITLLAAFVVGGVSYAMGWPPAASAGWVVAVVVAGVWLEDRLSASPPPPPGSSVCTFCGQTRAQVRGLVTTPTDDASICDGCAKLALELMEQLDEGSARPPTPPPPSTNPYAPPGD